MTNLQQLSNFLRLASTRSNLLQKNVANLSHSMMKKKAFKFVFQKDFFYFLDSYESRTIFVVVVGNLITLSLQFIKEVHFHYSHGNIYLDVNYKELKT